MNKFKIILNISIFTTVFFITQIVQAETVKPYLVTEGFEEDVPGNIRTYFTKIIPLEYKSGKVVVSLNHKENLT